jgi:hypothetical protein
VDPFSQLNLDASESVFLQRQLEQVMSKTYDIEYAALKFRQFIPVDSSLPSGTKSFSYKVFDMVGQAKMIASYADDAPRADAFGKEQFGVIRAFAAAYGYSVLEVKAGARTGTDLEQRKANAARRAIEEKHSSVALSGDTTFNLLGLNNQPNATVYSVPNGAGGTAPFSAKTADEILADMFGIGEAVMSATKNTHIPNTLLMPQAQYNLITRKRLGTTDGRTVLEQFLATNRYITTVEPWDDLKSAGTSSTDRMVCYEKNPDVLALIIPNDFQQLPPQTRNYEVVVNCLAETGGVVAYYPLALAYGDGI